MAQLPNDSFDIVDYINNFESVTVGPQDTLHTFPHSSETEDMLSLITSVLNDCDYEKNAGHVPFSSELHTTAQTLNAFNTLERHEDSISQCPQQSQNFFRDCPVCHSPGAGKHLYYGGRVCVSCRGFFKRSVESNHFRFFECGKAKKCTIEAKDRKNCRYCRFQKCLSNGMKVSYVMPAQERQVRLLKQMKSEKKKGLELMKRNFTLSFKFTIEEENEVNNLVDGLLNNMYGSYFRYFANDPSNLTQFLSASYSTGTLTQESLIQMDKEDEKQIKNFFFDCLEMQELCPYDRMNVIFQNYGKIHGLYWMISFEENGLGTFMDGLWNYGKARKELDPSIKLVLEQADEILGKMEKGIPSFQIDSWAPQYSRDQEFKDHWRKVKQISTWFHHGPNREFDRIRHFFLVMIALFFSEGIHLEDKEKIANFQNKYLWKLHRMLYTRNEKKNVPKLLHEGLMILSFVENAHQGHLKKILSR